MYTFVNPPRCPIYHVLFFDKSSFILSFSFIKIHKSKSFKSKTFFKKGLIIVFFINPLLFILITKFVAFTGKIYCCKNIFMDI